MTPAESTRTRELAEFYAQHHRRVARAVQGQARGLGDAVVADACAFAWLKLIPRGDVRLDARGVNWVITVAIRQAWTLGRLRRRETPAGAFRSERDPGELLEPEGLVSDPLDRVIAAEEHSARIERFGRSHPRERRDLLLKAAGYRYAEIATLTGSTYTAVNRRLTEGRRRLRTGA
jgi:DNA-directed RNA polymerase specialized sigma24 family protein